MNQYKFNKALSYLLNAKNEYSLHSPFMFDLYNAVFKARNQAEFKSIESLRKNLLKTATTIEVKDLGAGSTVFKSNHRPVSGITKHTSKKKKYARFLANLAHYNNSSSILELGTAMGISTSYLALKNPQASIHTIEGSESIADCASRNFKTLGLNNIHLHRGNFNDQLPGVINEMKKIDFAFIDGNHTYSATVDYFNQLLPYCNANTVMVFDDIYWSPEMTKAWEEIKLHDQVKASIDMFEFGIVFFNTNLSKQHFVLRY